MALTELDILLKQYEHSLESYKNNADWIWRRFSLFLTIESVLSLLSGFVVLSSEELNLLKETSTVSGLNFGAIGIFCFGAFLSTIWWLVIVKGSHITAHFTFLIRSIEEEIQRIYPNLELFLTRGYKKERKHQSWYNPFYWRTTRVVRVVPVIFLIPWSLIADFFLGNLFFLYFSILFSFIYPTILDHIFEKIFNEKYKYSDNTKTQDQNDKNDT